MKANLREMLRRGAACALAMVLALGCVSLTARAQAADRTPADYVFTDYVDGYHLVSFLDGYNVIAFGNVYSVLHMMGAVLIQGDYEGGYSNSGFADGENLPPSYIKGEYNALSSVYNSRNHTVDPLYVGSSNVVETWDENGRTCYKVNGVRTGNGSSTPVYVSDHFFNFAEAKEVIQADQATMLSRGRIVQPGEDGVVRISVGDNVIIESMDGVRRIDFVGDPNENVNTTVSILDEGAVRIEAESFNGAQPEVREQNDAGTAIVFSFPNADSVHLPTQNWVGHVVAPDADVRQDSGNYNGVIICDDLYTGAEGHIYSYNTHDTSWDVVFSLEKVWNDGNDADGIRPEYIEVQLLANGQPSGDVVRLTAAHDWYYVWPNLPEEDAEGNLIEYSAREVNVPQGYTSEYISSSQTLINHHDYETIDVSGTKTWEGDEEFGSRMRPMYLTVYLYADGEEIAKQTITVTGDKTQTYVFEDLPLKKNGQPIRYTVHEERVPGYVGVSDGYDLTNTWGGETVDISGVKTWNDDHNRDDLRPASITVQLLENGTVVEEHVTNAAHGWRYSFTGMPAEDQNGNKLVYTVREKVVPDQYTAEVSGYDITNTHIIETVDVSGRKTWDDNNNNDGKRPQSITVILLADQQEVRRVTVTAADDWAWSFEDLPKNHGGKPITYTVTEEPVHAYTAVTSGMNLINTHEDEKVEVSGRKHWNDDDNNDGKRPLSVEITLLQDDVPYKTVTVSEADDWAWSFADLPRYTAGREHRYAIREAEVEGYTSSVSGYDVTNTHENETIDLLGLKIWNDNNNNDGKRPDRLTVYLTKNGVRTGDSRTTTQSRNWYWLFEDLPMYEDGELISYGFEEEEVPGYTGPVIAQMENLPQGYGDVGFSMTNTHEDEKVEIKGSKTWKDDNNVWGMRPAQITVRLWKTVSLPGTTEISRTEVASKIVTAADNWAWDFGSLPKYEQGAEILYTITEDPVWLYSSAISGYDVTNSYTPGKVSISGVKYWQDAGDQDGLRPDSITVHLWKHSFGQTFEVDYNQDGKLGLEVTEADGWAWHFDDLNEYEFGWPVSYSITEDPVAGYESVVDQYDLINVHTPETTNVAGRKVWDDADNQDGVRPASIIIRLFKTVGTKTAEVRHAVVTAANNWEWNFVNLPAYENGSKITYSITEDPVPGYTAAIAEDGTVTNSHEPLTRDISGSKTWKDADNQDGKRPESIVINLLADGEKIDSKTVTAADGWKWKFENLPVNKGGKEIVYTIFEEGLDAYTAEISGFDVINTYTPEKTSVNGYKIWEDDGNRDGKRPQSIVISLLADGEKIDSRTITAANGWMWSFTDLPAYKDGRKIVYTIREDAVPGYESTVEGYIVTNTYDTDETRVFGKKTWVDGNDQDGLRPESIVINLLADGEKLTSRIVTEADGWAWMFDNLPKYESGREIVYTITEEAVAGYTTTVSGFDVTNSRNVQTAPISGVKTWVDENNQDGLRPAEITVRLLADGVEVDSTVATAADNWRWSFGERPTHKDGEPIAYSVIEDPVPGYTAMISGFTLTNTHEVKKISVSGRKTWVDNDDEAGLRPDSIVIRLLADGREVARKTVTAADGWTWTFDNLDEYSGGRKIVYTITEDAVDEYFTRINGFNVTNTYAQTEFAVTKVWQGDNGGRISLTLYANGEKVDPQPEYVKEGEVYIWRELPLYDEEGERIVYSAVERFMNGYMTIYDNPYPYDDETDRVYNGGTVINRATLTVKIQKVWTGMDEREALPRIRLHLFCNGEPVEMDTPVPDENGYYTYNNLPAYVGGVKAEYTVVEDPIPGYVVVYLDEDGNELNAAIDGGTIINHKQPATGDSAPLALWTAMLLISAAGLAMMAWNRRRHA